MLLGGMLGIALLHIGSALAFLVEPQWFYYRSWEWFEDFPYRSAEVGRVWEGPEKGDLSPLHLFFLKHERYTRVSSDEHGFRSVPLHAEQYPLLIAGDSTIWGCGLFDEETVPARVAQELGIPVFNGSRTDFSNVMKHPKLSKLKVVVDGRTERKIRGRVYQGYGDVGRHFKPLARPLVPGWKAYVDVNPLRYSPIARIPLLLGRLPADINLLRSGRVNDYYSFWPHRFRRGDLESAVAHIVRREQSMRKRGIRYIFLPIPAKQTLYRAEVDAFTRGHLRRLKAALDKRGVENVDLITPFLARKEEGLFQRHDTHWNELGARIAASEVVKQLRKKPLPDHW